ncbi:MAG: DUF2470 domain-containing protein [Candidatus Nanopelagicales bacterium]
MTEPNVNPFNQQIVDAVAHHMNLDHPEDSLLIVRSLGEQPAATEASVSGLDGDSITFDAVIEGRQQAVRVPWSTPLTERTQIRVEVTAMYYDACKALGVQPREAQAH